MTARLFANFLSGYLTFCAAAALAAALLLGWRAARLCRGERAQGVVIAYSRRMRERLTSSDHFMPVFRYSTTAGVEYEVQSRVGTIRPERVPPGTLVRVRYDPANPEIAEIASGGRIWLGMLGFLAMGGGALLAAWKAGG